ARAVHSCDGLHPLLLLLPDVTSNRFAVWPYGVLMVTEDALPARPMTLAISGEETLVPPTTKNPDWPLSGVLSKTATPVLGSAMAETSATARRLQPVPTLA